MKFNIYALLFLFNMLAGSAVLSQESKFVFFQNENRQPFYLAMNGKIYSSSATGYLILSKLQDGEYQFKIGFANDEFPEQPFAITVQKDMGLSLKNFGEKGWGLFNQQSMAMVMAGAPIKKEEAANAAKSTEEEPITFKPLQKTEVVSATLNTAQPATEAIVAANVEAAPVATDTISGEKTKKEEEIVKTNTSENQSADSAKQEMATTIIDSLSTAAAAIKEEGKMVQNEVAELVNVEPAETAAGKRAARKARKDGVRKVNEKTSSAGVSLTYLDNEGKATDTIQVVIPSETGSEGVAYQSSPSKAELKKAEVKTGASEENVGAEMVSSEQPGQPIASIAATAKKSNCKEVASDNDYAKVRRRMAQETSDEDMMAEARRFFKNKCITTDQVRVLSTLFLSDEGRLEFFDNIFPYVADQENYPVLQKEFIDPAVSQRFKTMFNK